MNNQISNKHLEFFLKLYEEKNLSEVSLKLGISQSAGSFLLSQLRKTFSDRLFIKTYGGMVPTEKCIQLIPQVEESLNSLNVLLKQRKTFLPEKIDKTFRLGVADNGLFTVIIPQLNRIRKQAPNIRFIIPELNFSHRFDALTANEIDLLVFPFQKHLLPPNILFQKLFEEHFVYVVRNGHPLTEIKEEQIAFNVNLYPKIRISPLKKYFFTDPSSEADITNENIYLKSPFFITSFFACLENNAVVVAPKKTAQAISKYLPLSILNTPQLRVRPIWPTLFWHESKNKDPANQWLRSMLIAGFKNKNP